MIDSVTDRAVVRSLLAEARIRPNKRYGQNFLVDRGVLADIESTVGCRSKETIVEIGPGLGGLTEALLRSGAKVVAVEVDRRLADLLGVRLGGHDRLKIVREDVLRLDFAVHLEGGPFYVVGSLPFRITSSILKHLVEQRCALSGALLVTQREVAEKVAASPGKDGSSLGVYVRAFADVALLRPIGRRSFEPIPEVDSSLWRMTFRERPRFTADETLFFRTVRALYGARRKMLRRALRDLVSADAVDPVLTAAGLRGDVRGETLSFDELDRLAVAVGASADGES